MIRTTLCVLLATSSVTCFQAPPDRSVDPGPVTRPTETTRPQSKPVVKKVEKYPGGEVTLTGGVIVSVGRAKAMGGSAQQRLMAQRAAYLLAVRNAGLFMAGLRTSPGGRIARVKDGHILADVTVKNFRQTSSTFDKKTLTAGVTVEILLPPATPDGEQGGR